MNSPRICFDMRRFGIVVCLISLVFAVSCKSRRQAVEGQPPVGWIDWANPERVDSLARRCASYSKVVNDVQQTGGIVHIESKSDEGHFNGVFLTEPLPFPFQPAGTTGARRVQKLSDGWLVGFNHGEFGGSVWFLSPDGSKSTKLLDENVTKIVELFGRTFVFTNAAGQGFRGGAIYEVGAGGVIKNHLDFDAFPQAFVQDSSNSILLVNDSGVYRISSELKSEELFKKDLSGFEPNSIAIAGDGSIYLGMHFFVLRLIPEQKSYKQQWLVPSTCRNLHIEPEQRNCVCD